MVSQGPGARARTIAIVSPSQVFTMPRVARNLSHPDSVRVLHVDENMLVLFKPSGMLVHRGWGQADVALVDCAREYTEGGLAHPIQRLDRGASGPVLFARSSAAAKRLSQWAAQGHCRKRYLALVRGLTPESLVIDHPMTRRVDGPELSAKTEFRLLASVECEPRAVSLIDAAPLTGRLHQIRRHLKHVNHPLIGDANYGRGELNRAFRARYGLGRLALHAWQWTIESPESGVVLGGNVPIPEDFAVPLAAIGFNLIEISKYLSERDSKNV